MRMRNKPWVKPILEQCAYYHDDAPAHRGHWHDLFAKKQPLHLELGCGKGVFIAELACRHPEINYIGMDMKSIVLGSAIKNVESAYAKANRAVDNVQLVTYDIERILNIMNNKDQVDRLYINFCNPWPKPKQHKKRLTYTRQLKRYQAFLKPYAELHFKTDDLSLYQDTVEYLRESGFELLYQTQDLHHSDYPDNILTEHEIMFSEQGIPIKFLIARYVPEK